MCHSWFTFSLPSDRRLTSRISTPQNVKRGVTVELGHPLGIAPIDACCRQERELESPMTCPMTTASEPTYQSIAALEAPTDGDRDSRERVMHVRRSANHAKREKTD